MATTPDDRPEYTKTERVIAAVERVTSTNYSRVLTAIAAGLCVGFDRPPFAVALSIVVYVTGGKK